MESKAYLLDCMEGMKQFPDKHFELAIVDPPYGIGEDGSLSLSRVVRKDGTIRNGIDKRNGAVIVRKPSKYKPKEWDKTPPPNEYFIELVRVSKNQIIWGANHFISRMPFDSPAWIVWDKVNGSNDFADCELAWTSFKNAVRLYPFMWNGMLQGSVGNGRIMEGDISKREKRIHPTHKPVQLYRWLLHHYAKSGDKILDSHLGSGSSRIAAYEMGFDFTGYEIDADYFAAQEKRFKEYTSQTRLPLTA